MAAGPVNQALLESFYQNAGEIYDDTKSEGALQVIVNQVNDNWTDYAGVKAVLNSVTPGNSGSEYVKSAPISGVSGATVHAQMTNIEEQIQALVVGSIPTGSVTYDKLNPVPTAVNNPNTLPVRNASNQIEVGSPSTADHAANKAYVDAVTAYVNASLPVSGMYTGNGAATRDIALPFTPSAILLTDNKGNMNTSSAIAYGGLALNGSPSLGNSLNPVVTIGTNKVTVEFGTGPERNTNVSGVVYHYLAFK